MYKLYNNQEVSERHGGNIEHAIPHTIRKKREHMVTYIKSYIDEPFLWSIVLPDGTKENASMFLATTISNYTYRLHPALNFERGHLILDEPSFESYSAEDMTKYIRGMNDPYSYWVVIAGNISERIRADEFLGNNLLDILDVNLIAKSLEKELIVIDSLYTHDGSLITLGMGVVVEELNNTVNNKGKRVVITVPLYKVIVTKNGKTTYEYNTSYVEEALDEFKRIVVEFKADEKFDAQDGAEK